MAALESASVGGDIKPFAQLLASLIGNTAAVKPTLNVIGSSRNCGTSSCAKRRSVACSRVRKVPQIIGAEITNFREIFCRFVSD